MNERLKDEPAARLELESGYRFRVSFGDDRRDLITDLAPPLGHGAGAEPTELLAAAVGSCLASSLLYCARKARIEPLGIRAEVRVTPERREGRVRIGRIEVHLVPRILESDRARFGVCLERFESYCTVAESVRRGIPIQVLVEPLTAPVPLEAHEPSAA